jgi:HlyD family secretion protein
MRQASASYDSTLSERKIAEVTAKEEEASSDRESDRLGTLHITASAELEAAKARLERTKKLASLLDERIAKDPKPAVSDLVQQAAVADQIEMAKVQISRAQGDYIETGAARRIYLEFTKPRRQAAQKEAIEKANHRVTEAKALLGVELAKLAKLKRNLENAKVQASRDGYIELANDPTQNIPTIRSGATVRERQRLFQIWDIAEGFSAEVKFPESYVDRLKVGQKVNVGVDAMHGKTFNATIQSIAPIPDPTTTRDQPKVYTVIVNIDQPGEWLRPGMTTSNRFVVELDPERVKNIQARVPRTAVAKVGKAFQVAVRKADGKVEWRDVTLTDATDESAGIKSGLKPGDEVARDAIALMSETEREEKQASYIPSLAESLRNTEEELDARQNVSRATLEELRRLSPEQRETLMRSLADPR